VFAIGAILIIGALCHFHISLTAAVLSVTLVSEVLVLFALAFSVIFKGGGPDGFMLNQTVLLNNAFESLPAGAFGTAAAAGSMAIGLFFAFWSWVGFETTAVYGEESRNPKKIIPRATLIAVIGLGLFYTFISAMVLAGNGAKTSVETSISASPLDLFFGLVQANLGTFLLDVYKTRSSSDHSHARWLFTMRRRATSTRSVAKFRPAQCVPRSGPRTPSMAHPTSPRRHRP